jgi:anti-anti-sigma regulatory factor
MLTGVNRKIAELLEITRLDGLFVVAPDEASALQQIAQPQVADQS